MSQQAHRMQALVSDLLTLSRLEGSPLPGVSEWMPLPALQAQCEDEARGLAAALGSRRYVTGLSGSQGRLGMTFRTAAILLWLPPLVQEVSNLKR